MRPSKNEYYLAIAEAVSRRGTCLRRNFGAVIVKDDHIVSTGYTGSPRKAPNCCDVGLCLREEYKVPHGQMYELCRSIHAEMNAIIHASREQMMGATMYLVGFEHKSGTRVKDIGPCKLCKRIIINAGIRKLVIRIRSKTSVLDPNKWAKNEREIFASESEY